MDSNQSKRIIQSADFKR